MMPEDTKDQFIQHAALIVRQDGVKVSKARWTAWVEGPDGYKERLAKESNQ